MISREPSHQTEHQEQPSLAEFQEEINRDTTEAAPIEDDYSIGVDFGEPGYDDASQVEDNGDKIIPQSARNEIVESLQHTSYTADETDFGEPGYDEASQVEDNEDKINPQSARHDVAESLQHTSHTEDETDFREKVIVAERSSKDNANSSFSPTVDLDIDNDVPMEVSINDNAGNRTERDIQSSNEDDSGFDEMLQKVEEMLEKESRTRRRRKGAQSEAALEAVVSVFNVCSPEFKYGLVKQL